MGVTATVPWGSPQPCRFYRELRRRWRSVLPCERRESQRL